MAPIISPANHTTQISDTAPGEMAPSAPSRPKSVANGVSTLPMIWTSKESSAQPMPNASRILLCIGRQLARSSRVA